MESSEDGRLWMLRQGAGVLAYSTNENITIEEFISEYESKHATDPYKYNPDKKDYYIYRITDINPSKYYKVKIGSRTYYKPNAEFSTVIKYTEHDAKSIVDKENKKEKLYHQDPRNKNDVTYIYKYSNE